LMTMIFEKNEHPNKQISSSMLKETSRLTKCHIHFIAMQSCVFTTDFWTRR